MTEGHIPYCGSAPVPGSLTWNIDPILCIVLLGLAGLHFLALPPTIRRRKGRVAVLGWGIVTIALISPLCNLGAALFSARLGQHMLIILIGAPMIASAPGLIRRLGIFPAVGTFAVALWSWHMPGPYDATFQSDGTYWLMHGTLIASAIWLWDALLAEARSRPGVVLIAAFLTTMQMSLLGAILTFSPRALFAVHFGTTAAWGLSPLGDQQLGGLIMWVPAGFVLVAYGLYALGHQIRRTETAAPLGVGE